MSYFTIKPACLLCFFALILDVDSQSRSESFLGPQFSHQFDPLSQINNGKVNYFDRPSQQQQQQQQYQQYQNPQQYYNTQTHRYPIQSQQQFTGNQPQSYQVQQQQQQSRPIQSNDRSRPQISLQQQYSTFQNNRPQLDQRFSDASIMRDDANSYGSIDNDFTTRRPQSTIVPKVTRPSIPPPVFSSRFDDINSRKLTWDEELSRNTEIFALKLFAFLTHFETKNLMISPYSIHSLLVVLAEGAEGNTYNELNNALGLINKQRARDFNQYTNLALSSKNSTDDVSIKKFSAMIGDKNRPIGREYEDNVEKIYDVEYIPVNFKDVENTLNEVNGIVYQNTNGQIPDAISRDDLLKAQLILLSGIHFKGNWKNVFNKTFTKIEPFYDINQEREIGRVNMMFKRGPFAYAANQNLGCYLLELPYGSKNTYGNRNNLPEGTDDNRISMIVVLPKRGLSLVDAIDNVNKYGMKSVLLELKKAKEEFEDEEVEVHIPRFELGTSLNLVQTLQDMGINDIFEQSTANLSGINNNYYVSSIVHKTKIRVDEKGTEASGVTSAIFANKATPPKFHANRPFFYFIVDKSTRLILFAGVYRTPTIF